MQDDDPNSASARAELDARERALLDVLAPRYRVVRPLGRGAQKSVWLAHDTSLDRDVALALLREGEGASGLDEARALARLGGHPGIASIYDVVEMQRAVVIAMEYASGGTLAARLARTAGGIPLGEALAIAAQVCRALEHAHANGVRHGDVQPHNVLFAGDGRALLVDFGLAGDVEATRVDEVAGSPDYLAPEAMRLASAGPSTDLYGVGCMLYELATGAPPFAARSMRETLARQQLAVPDLAPLARAGAPPALVDLVARLLAKDAAQRPASARDVRFALEGMRAAGPVANERAAGAIARGANLDSIPGRVENARHGGRWIGRAAERRAALALLDRLAARSTEAPQLQRARDRRSDAAARAGGAIRIAGAGGMGKSRLLDELAAEASTRGHRVVRACAIEGPSSMFAPIVRALAPWSARIGELAAGDAARLRRMLGEVGAAPASHAAPTERALLFSAVARFLDLLAEDRGLVLVLDDLHWADDASLDLTAYLLDLLSRAPHAHAFALAVAHRNAPPGSGFARFAEQAAATAASIDVGALDAAGVYELLELLGHRRASQQLVSLLLDESGGNPLFVADLAQQLARTGALVDRGGFLASAVPAEQLTLPPDLEASAAARAHALPPRARAVVRIAAHVDMEIDPEELAELASEPLDAVESALREAADVDLVVASGDRFAFAHPIVRSALRALDDDPPSARLHAELAGRIEKRCERAGVEAAPRIAAHLELAGDWCEPERLLRAAARAGEIAQASCAWGEAGRCYAAAARAAEALGDAARAGDLFRRAGRVYHLRADPGPAIDAFARAVAHLRAAGTRAELLRALSDGAHAAMQFQKVPFGQLHPDIAEIEALLAEMEAISPRLEASVAGTLAEAYFTAHDADRGERHASRALALSDEIADDVLAADLALNCALSRLQRLDLRGALDVYDMGCEHARRAGDLVGMEMCHQRAATLLVNAGQLTAAEERAATADAINRTTLHAGDASLSLAAEVGRHVLRGDLARAEEVGARALELALRSRYPWSAALLMPTLALGRVQAGRWADAHAAIRALATPGEIFADPGAFQPFARRYRWLVDAYAGEHPDVDLAAIGTGAEFEGVESFDWILVPDLCLRLELADLAGVATATPAVERALALARTRGFVVAAGWPFFVPRILGVAAAARSDWDTAERAFANAERIAVRERAACELARTNLDRARMLASRDAAGDRARARALLARESTSALYEHDSLLSERALRLREFLER